MSQATATARKSNEMLATPTVYLVAKALPPAPALPVVVQRMVHAFDGKRDLAAVYAEVQVSEARGDAIVRKLTQMGIVRTTPSAQTEASVSGSCEPAFTPEEEAFFASEVEPIDECDLPFESLGEKIELFVSEMILRLKGSPVLG